MSPEQQRQWRKEVWGLAWQRNARHPGLAYCLGGRSLFWFGWSPQLLVSEMLAGAWSIVVVNDLKNRYFAESGKQLAVTSTVAQLLDLLGLTAAGTLTPQ